MEYVIYTYPSPICFLDEHNAGCSEFERKYIRIVKDAIYEVVSQEIA